MVARDPRDLCRDVGRAFMAAGLACACVVLLVACISVDIDKVAVTTTAGCPDGRAEVNFNRDIAGEGAGGGQPQGGTVAGAAQGAVNKAVGVEVVCGASSSPEEVGE